MKFLRMRPEMCARAWCLFSSSTLNMALGRVSTTVAITSIASSFDKRSPWELLGLPLYLHKLVLCALGPQTNSTAWFAAKNHWRASIPHAASLMIPQLRPIFLALQEFIG